MEPLSGQVAGLSIALHAGGEPVWGDRLSDAYYGSVEPECYMHALAVLGRLRRDTGIIERLGLRAVLEQLRLALVSAVRRSLGAPVAWDADGPVGDLLSGLR